MITSVWIVLMLLMGPSTRVPQNELEGHWKGVIVRDSSETPFLLDLERRNGNWGGSFSFPEQRVLQYPLGRVDFAAPNVTIAGPGNSFTLEGALSEDALIGVFKDAIGPATFRVKRSTPEEVPYTTEDVRFANGDATLAGSLDIPKGPGPHPAVILLHGPGPEIRRRASRFLSDYFARRGIAALIYDKRGAGEATGDWRRSDFNAPHNFVLQPDANGSLKWPRLYPATPTWSWLDPLSDEQADLRRKPCLKCRGRRLRVGRGICG